MHGTAVFQVSHHGDVHAIDLALLRLKFFFDGVKIQQRLGGMFIWAITAIDDRYPAGFGKLCHGTYLGMAHNDHIAVSADDSGGVIQGLALGNGRGLHIGGFPNMTAQQVESATEADPGAGTGLEEHIAENSAPQDIAYSIAVGIGFHIVSDLKDLVDIGSFKLFYADYMSAAEIHEAILVIHLVL